MRLDVELARLALQAHVPAPHAHDVGAGFFQLADLVDGRGRVGGQRIGHRLDDDGHAAADDTLQKLRLAINYAKLGFHDIGATGENTARPGRMEAIKLAQVGLNRWPLVAIGFIFAVVAMALAKVANSLWVPNP